MRFRVLPFFALVLGWTWAFHVPFAAAGWSVDSFPHNLLLLSGGLGPPLSAAFFVYRTQRPVYIREYLARIISVRRVPLWAWLFVFSLPFAVSIAGMFVSAFSGAGVSRPVIVFDAAALADITPFYILLMLLAPLLEEVAWRGYGQDSLQSRFGLVSTSVILGLVWWVWHFPLFFMADTYQSGLGVGTPAFWEFGAFIVATAFVMTWLFNVTHGSILVAVVYHFLLNVAGEMWLTDLTADFARTIIQLALGLFLLLLLPRLRRGAEVEQRLPVWQPTDAS